MHYLEDLTLLIEACKKVGPIILKHYQCDLDIKIKNNNTPVTQADLEADAFLKKFLTTARPNYGWLSEETEDNVKRLSKKRVWVVDPIDGTKAFIKGTGEFCVSVALVEDGVPVAGVVYAPVYDDLYSAFQGGGCFLNGEEVRPAETKPLVRSTCFTSPREEKLALFEPYQGKFLRAPVHSIAFKLAKIASGEGDFMVTLDEKCEWDTAAGHVLCTEAGLTVSTLAGGQVLYNQQSVYLPGLIVAPSHLYADIKDLTPDQTITRKQ